MCIHTGTGDSVYHYRHEVIVEVVAVIWDTPVRYSITLLSEWSKVLCGVMEDHFVNLFTERDNLTHPL